MPARRGSPFTPRGLGYGRTHHGWEGVWMGRLAHRQVAIGLGMVIGWDGWGGNGWAASAAVGEGYTVSDPLR